MNRISIETARKHGYLKRSKYGNNKTEYNGNLYDSQKEATRAQQLDIMLQGNAIKGWERQVPLKIEYNGVKICTYKVDFVVTHLDGTTDYEDVKGYVTDIYKLKKKLVKAFYGIDIIEI